MDRTERGLEGGHLHGLVIELLKSGASQGGDLNDRAAQLFRQLGAVDLVAPLFNHIHHVQGYHYGYAQLQHLGGEIEVALQIGGVHQVENHVRALVEQIISAHHLLQRVGGEGVDTRKVGDGNVGMTFQLAFFLFYRHAGPVAYILVGAGHGVEHGGFPAVWVAHQSHANGHSCFLLLLANANS